MSIITTDTLYLSPFEESDAAAMFYKNNIIPVMNSLRASVDEMETLCSSEHWCYPSYGDLLFSVR